MHCQIPIVRKAALGLRQVCGSAVGSSMASLPKLPFPVSELAWDKFDVVMESAQLERDDAVKLMTMVCGDPPPDFET